MSTTLGISLAASQLRAVLVRRGQVVAASEREIDEAEPLESAIEQLVRTVPIGRFRRPRVVVALGPSRAQVRRISGLPHVSKPRVLAQLVQQSADTFFLRSGRALLLARLDLEAPGTTWAAALDEECVRAAVAGCRAAGVRVRAVVAAAGVLPLALTDRPLVWRDGEIATEVTTNADGSLASVRRIPAALLPGSEAELHPVPALQVLGERAACFADAYAATRVTSATPLRLHPTRTRAARPAIPAWRIAAAGLALAASVAAAAAGPPLKARQAEAVAAAELASLQRERRAVADTERELERITATLADVEHFAAGRQSPTLLLEQLTRALPDGTALVSLRVDSAGGSLVALAPRAASVLAPLERVPAITAPAIVGPVTREIAAGRQVERVNIRFGLSRQATATITKEQP
jgi:hypothetical protein